MTDSLGCVMNFTLSPLMKGGGSKVAYLIFAVKIREEIIQNIGFRVGGGEWGGVLLDELKGALITDLPPHHPSLNLCQTPSPFITHP